MTRQLEIIPILHTETDLGGLAQTLRDSVGEAAWQARQAAIAEFWQRVRAWSESLGDDLSGVRVYQDAMPVDPKAEPIQVAGALADRGSANHQILLDCAQRGAVLMGTEDPALLIEEVELAKAEAEGRRDHRHEFKSRRVLERRDRFIADRIDATLDAQERAILFLGMFHAVEGMLAADIEISHPLGTPKGVLGNTRGA